MSPRQPSVLLLTLLVLGATPVDAAERISCPDGEITLAVERARLVRRGAGHDRLRVSGGAFTLPRGVVAAPRDESVVVGLEADGVPLLTVGLPAGTLAGRDERLVHRDGRGFALSLEPSGAQWALSWQLRRADLAGLDPANPPQHLRLLLKIGDDCFSSVLACATGSARVDCRPARSAALRGHVWRGRRDPLPGAMVTAYDDARLESISVFVQEDGSYRFPALRPGAYRMRVRLAGWLDATRQVALAAGRLTSESFTMAATSDLSLQLPPTHFAAPLLARWPDPIIRGDFTLSCGNCHQIGAWRFRREKSLGQWDNVLTRMITNLPPYFQETRDTLKPNVLATFGPGAPPLDLTLPPPPSGDALAAVIYEYGLGDATSRPGCHDLELGTDGVVYADAGVRWIDPRAGRRGVHPLDGGAHSIERGPNGDMWITQADEDRLARMTLPEAEFTYWPLPKLGEDQGAYPHTLRFDEHGVVWMTLTKSNHVASFDPATETFEYHRLPEADPGEVGLSIPVAYGCDVAPDGGVWWSQLFGQRIGHVDPSTGEVRAWKPPFWGPRRLHADQDGILWVPGYGDGVLGRFDPAIERWKVYDLPSGLPDPDGYGTSETPYSLNANRRTGEVWVTGSNSDTLVRFDPVGERFTVFPLPSRGSFTREVEFDADNNVWTCTSNEQGEPGVPGRGKFVKIELPPPAGVCGNGRLEPGEECDDGGRADCDGCSAACVVESGCGDGVACGAEACDDGNHEACDSCSPSCAVESGLRCGDGAVNAACGEECDPPRAGGCSTTCEVVARCGDGSVDAGEACDDGNDASCDGCSATCGLESGCGDGVQCGLEACDDGNHETCDGCSSTCAVEVGALCGDGIVSAACGEQCDPPDEDCSLDCRLGATPPLGTRRLSFGGNAYSSALGTGVPLGTLVGALDLVAGTPSAAGVAPVTVMGPVFYRAPLLGGAFGHLCIRITSCTGFVDCLGASPVGVQTVQDSAGPGAQGNPITLTTGLGDPGGAGAVLLTCQQSYVQTPPARQNCPAETYPADAPVAYTTGTTDAFFLNGAASIGSGRLTVTGERFDCSAWSAEDGPGILAGTYLQENAPQAGDTANANLIDD